MRLTGELARVVVCMVAFGFFATALCGSREPELERKCGAQEHIYRHLMEKTGRWADINHGT